jgi:RHS repeat-associated protein
VPAPGSFPARQSRVLAQSGLVKQPRLDPNTAASAATSGDDYDGDPLAIAVTGSSGPVDWFDSGPGSLSTPGMPEVSGMEGEGVVYPGESLTAYASVYAFDDTCAEGSCTPTSQPMEVSWEVDCNGGESTYTDTQIVDAPGVASSWADPSVPGALASLQFTVDPAQCAIPYGPRSSYAVSENFWVNVYAFPVGSTFENSIEWYLTDGYELQNVPPAELRGCPGAGNSAGFATITPVCGDPVDTSSGAFADSFTDATLNTAGYPLAVSRDYSSAIPASGPLGPGWTMPWFASLSADSSTGDVTFNAENGSQFVYTSNGNGTFAAPPGAESVLKQASSGGYTLTTPQNDILAFDSSGRLATEQDPTGRGLTFSYNGSGQLAQVADAAGQSIALTWSNSLLSGVKLPDSQALSYAYTNGRLTSVTTPGGSNGATTSYAYDSSGRLDSIKDPDGNYSARNTYDSSGQVTSQEDGAGNTTTFSYTTTTDGLPETDVTDPNGGITSFVYADSLPVETIDPLGGETSYVYDAALQLNMVGDPLNNDTTTTHDTRGNLLTQTDPLGDEQQWTYDPSNNMLSSTDADGSATHYTYNDMDEVTSVTMPSGGKTTYTYDSSGNLTSTVDPRGNVSGANATSYATTDTYNDAQQLTSETDPDGNKTSYTYDAMGYPLTMTDPRGQMTTYGYDSAERQNSVQAPDGGTTRSAYDLAGNLVAQTDADGNATAYTYDADNRVARVTDALGNSATYGYDSDGNAVTFKDARGITSTTTYDTDNRPTKITYSDGTPSVTETYDKDGNVTGVTDATGSRTMSYDAAGHLTGTAGPGSGSFGYTYDAQGNVTSRAYPDTTKVSYQYNSDGEISSMSTGSSTTAYSYDPAGNLVSTAEPNGVTEARNYDDAGQLTGIADTRSGTTLDSYGLTLNQDGQPSQVSEIANGAAQPTQYYTFDSVGRLTSACGSSSGTSACSAASSGTATGVAPDPVAAVPKGAVTNGEAGLCMDDSGGATTNGNKVDIYSCNGGTGQQWTIESNGTIELGGSCLDIKGAGTTNGSLIDLYTCVGQANQQWKAGSNNSLVNPVSGMCLSDPNASTTNGTQLIIAPCNGQTQQRWRTPSSGLAPAGALSSGLSGKCLDDASAASTDGNKVDISSCTGGPGQDWTVQADGTVRVFGKCLDVKGAGTANSTLVDLYTCNGQANQIWEAGPPGYLVNPASGKCLDDPGSSTTNGTQLNIYTCVGGAANEVWTLPTTTVPAVPASVKVTAGAGSAALTWTPPSAAGGSALTGYTITAAPGGATATAGPYAAGATVAGLTPGTAYTFTITASNGVGSSTTAATSAVTPDNETTWSYDQAGNTIGTETDGLTTANTYNADEQLTQAVTGASTTSYGYDADGDLTTAGGETYGYDGAGQMNKAVTPAGTFSYSYDSQGDLSATDLNGSLIQGTVWDTNDTLPTAAEDTGPTGATVNDYVYGEGGNLAVLSGGNIDYAIRDWLGSVTGLLNSSGNQVSTTSYSPYGVASTTVSAAGSPVSGLGFAGSYTVPGNLSLDDMHARDYSPGTGTFTATDPWVSVSNQPYAYASDDPVGGTDPTGLITCPNWVPGCGVVTDLQHGLARAGGWFLTQLACATGVVNGIYVTTPRGVTYKIPEGWTSEPSRTNKGIIFRPPGSEGNANTIRIMEPTSRYPNGYVVIYNSEGQPVDYNLKSHTGPDATHIEEDEEGPFPELPLDG